MNHEIEHLILVKLNRIERNQGTIMAGIADLQAIEQAERADLATLTGLINQILTAVASGQMTAQQAQDLLTAMTTDDATVKSNISTIQAALPVAPPVEPPPAAPTA